MEKSIIVIGAGISGLMAGALLVKKGKKVLILESQPKIGGYLSGFTRKGYYFDVGITRSNISYVEPYLREAGILDDIHFIKIDGDYYVNGRYVPYDNLREYFYAGRPNAMSAVPVAKDVFEKRLD
jgi:phytoene dehydrogenase-like protein